MHDHEYSKIARQLTAIPDSLRFQVFQAAHGLVAGDPAYHNGTIWIKALGTDTDTQKIPVGVVELAGTNVFTIVLRGRIRIPTATWTPGRTYYLAAAGGLTLIPTGISILTTQLSPTEGLVNITSFGVNVLSETLGTDVLVTVGGTQYKGIISPGVVPTEVPQADPSALVSFPAYLGKSRLNGGAYVWVGIIVKPSGVNLFDLLAPLPNNQKFESRQSVQMPITGGGGATATLYLPWVL